MTSSRTAVPAADGCLTRRVVVTPGMCGSGPLFYGQIGDWTWEAVGKACHTNVHTARNAAGDPTYLSFYYFHVRSGVRLHPYGVTFGDEIDVTSRVLDAGRGSVLTLHRLAPAGSATCATVLEPEEYFEHPRADCLYAQNFNRWITRGVQNSNRGLVRSTPPGFRPEHLGRLPSAYSPYPTCGNARRDGTLYSDGVPGHVPLGEEFILDYPLDLVRDINGVGLMYFASYFAIVDSALLKLWRVLGRTGAQFLRRRVNDLRMCYFGNADLDSILTIAVRLWQDVADPLREVADVCVREKGTDRLLAVAGVHLSRRQA